MQNQNEKTMEKTISQENDVKETSQKAEERKVVLESQEVTDENFKQLVIEHMKAMCWLTNQTNITINNLNNILYRMANTKENEV